MRCWYQKAIYQHKTSLSEKWSHTLSFCYLLVSSVVAKDHWGNAFILWFLKKRKKGRTSSIFYSTTRSYIHIHTPTHIVLYLTSYFCDFYCVRGGQINCLFFQFHIFGYLMIRWYIWKYIYSLIRFISKVFDKEFICIHRYR